MEISKQSSVSHCHILTNVGVTSTILLLYSSFRGEVNTINIRTQYLSLSYHYSEQIHLSLFVAGGRIVVTLLTGNDPESCLVLESQILQLKPSDI